MNSVWRTIRDYILWSYERGTVQYDVMVTIILLFIFFSPRVINFNDKPIERNPHPTGVVVSPDSAGGLIYQIEASAITQSTDEGVVRGELLKIIEPISGEISINKYEAVRDTAGHIVKYRVWVRRE